MANTVVRVSFERDGRKRPRHPRVEGIVQEQINSGVESRWCNTGATVYPVRLLMTNSGDPTFADVLSRLRCSRCKTDAPRARGFCELVKTNYWGSAMSNGWTPERRARAGGAHSRWKPRERSCRPKTERGKIASAKKRSTARDAKPRRSNKKLGRCELVASAEIRRMKFDRTSTRLLHSPKILGSC